MQPSYPLDMTMRSARDLYFQVNDFGADGGYADTWVDFKIGPVPLPFPNTAGRIAAVKFHDLHHVLTGYETNASGEFEISAWEIGAGCRVAAAAPPLARKLASQKPGLQPSPDAGMAMDDGGRVSESCSSGWWRCSPRSRAW